MSIFHKERKMQFKGFKNSLEASEFVAQEMLEEIRKGKQINLGLATGSTPILLYKLLIDDYNDHKTSWEHVSTYNLDEYLGLPEEHPQTYKVFMKDQLFSKVNINLENTHFPTIDADYDQLIKSHGGIDIQILGIGTNGHIGFNEPGSPLKSLTRVVDLTEETIKVNAEKFFNNDISQVPTKAISMGLESILNAKKIYLLAFGLSKKEAMHKLYNSKKFDIDFPASALLKHNDVTIIFDKETELNKEMKLDL
ncbi:MAG: glucosamine-6-phosphate deaminase [Metamycoplasmataceae bacterium]